MKKGWEYKKLGDCFISINNGANIKQVKGAKGIPITRIETLSNDKFNRERMGYADIFDASPYSSYILNDGDILMSHINSMKYLGRAVQYSKIEEETIIHGMNLLRLVPTKDVLSSFLIYQFYTAYFRNQIVSISHQSVNQASFNTTNLKSLKLKIPPITEQQSIVDYLDSAFAKIDAMKANAEKVLNEAKALFQASLKEMLEPKEGWEEKALKDLGQTQTGTTPSKSDKSNYGDYIEFIRPSEIDYDGNGRIDYNCEIKLSEQGASKGRVFASNSILMVCIGATIGKVGFSTKKVSCNQQINVLTPKNDLNYKFVYYAMRSPSFQHRVIKEGTSSQATLPIINKGKWEQLSICFPEIKEQEVIATHLDNLSSKVSDLKENYNKISQECDALKQAILRQVFE